MARQLKSQHEVFWQENTNKTVQYPQYVSKTDLLNHKLIQMGKNYGDDTDQSQKCNEIVLEFMMTSSNGNIFRVTGHLCGKFADPRWISRTKASDAELWCFFDLRLNKRLSKQPWGWWFETPAWSLWRHRNVQVQLLLISFWVTHAY